MWTSLCIFYDCPAGIIHKTCFVAKSCCPAPYADLCTCNCHKHTQDDVHTERYWSSFSPLACRAGCLPAWTPVLGLEEDVAKFNSLPPSLFMPLSSLCCLLSSGMSVKAVGLPELQRYDK